MTLVEPVLLPGQPLELPSRAPKPSTGRGAYERGSHILSSLVGQRVSSGSTLGVQSGSAAKYVVPQPGSTILGRVTRVTPRQANVSILVVDGLPCSMGDRSSASFANHAAGEDPMGGDFTGVIRSQDVRSTEKDKIRMGDCFRPGDIVKATVVSEYFPFARSTVLNHLFFDAFPLIDISWRCKIILSQYSFKSSRCCLCITITKSKCSSWQSRE